jgi:hypothetical protein
MIMTPDHVIKKYFPKPAETTRDLYNQLGFDESVYPYLNWLKDAEAHCLAKYVDESQYQLLPDDEKNYRISPKAFRTILETSPSKIGDEIRNCFADISRRVASDPSFARQLQDQLDQEAGITKIAPRVSRTLKAQYNQTGQDAFEFSLKSDNRLYLDVISGYNFQPGEKIKDAAFLFKLVAEDGIPYHIVDMIVTLTNEHSLSYRTIWSASEARPRYGSIFMNRMIRVNLFEDNKKLVDSFDYVVSPSETKALESDLEKVLTLLVEKDMDEIDLDQLGKNILYRYNLNDQAYAQAIKTVVPAMLQQRTTASADMLEAEFHNAVDRYWEYYVLQPDPTSCFTDDLEQMIKDRIPRINLSLTVIYMLDFDDLFNKYFKQRYNSNQKEALLIEGNIRLIYSLAEATGFDPGADHQQRIIEMCAFVSEHLD